MSTSLSIVHKKHDKRKGKKMKTRMKARTVSMPVMVVFAASTAMCDVVDATKPGFRQVSGVSVSQGATQTVSDDVIVDPQGEFRKAGEGKLVVPMSRVNRQLPWGMTVSEGTLRLEAGDDATLPIGTVPQAFYKAVLWLDASSAVVTNSDDTSYVAKWVDVRDAGHPDSPVYVYALPAWGSNSPNKSIPPVRVEKDGRQALYFGGLGSGKHMNLSSTVQNVIHQFVVHGAYDCFGPVIGHSVSREGMTLSAASQCLAMPLRQHFVARAELCPDYAAARHSLDGEWLAPYTTGPKRGFQLMSTHFLHRMASFNKIFRSSFEVVASGDTDYSGYVQGGDYVGEIVVFNCRLTSGEVQEISRYLMRKWRLPYSDGSTPAFRHLPDGGTIGIADGATLEVDAANSEETVPSLAVYGAGSVVKSGAGTLELGPDNGTSSGVTMSLDGGTVLSRGGRPLPVLASGGERYTAAIFNVQGSGSRTADTDISSGAKLTKGSCAADKVVKEGNDWLRVNGVASGVKVIEVNGGVLQLEAKSYPSNLVSGPVAVNIENADFEAPVSFAGANGRCPLGTAGVHGWRSGNNGAYYIAHTNSAALSWFGENPRPQPVPSSGAQALLLYQTGYADTDIEIPVDGDYDIEFCAASKFGVGKGGAQYGAFVQVLVGESTSALRQFGGDIHPSGFNFSCFRIRLNGLTAGRKVLRLKGDYNVTDGALVIDDVRMVYCGKSNDDGIFKIPNGDFEIVVASSSRPRHVTDYSPLNVPDGWTFACTNAEVGAETLNAYVGLAAPGVTFVKALTGTSTLPQAVLTSELQSAPFGSKMLFFLRTQAYAKTTFTVPAGRYYLRGNCARNANNFTCNGSERNASSDPGVVHAKLTLEGSASTKDLGSVALYDRRMVAMTWPDVFEVPFEQPVTLELEQTRANGSALVDDLVFVQEAQALDDSGILKCGGGEESASGVWTFSGDKSYFKNSAADVRGYDQGSNTKYYGYAGFEGDKVFSFQCCGTALQQVKFAEAGLYRFTCHARTRADSTGYSGNAIRFWFSRVGSAVTNVIDTMPAPYSCNFLERSYTFTVPEAGDYYFGLSGQGVPGAEANADKMTYLDGMSIHRVTEVVDDVPAIPEELRIRVASGARMVLDFKGTNVVRSVRLGNTLLTCGIVDGRSHPDFIGGSGALRIVSKGLVIMVQ